MKQLIFARRLALAIVSCAALATQACATSGPDAGSAPPPTSRAARRAMAAACKDDYRRLCGGVERGEGRVVACLRDHAAELAPTCRDALTRAGVLAAEAPAPSSTPH